MSDERLRVCIGGGGGFIGSHLARRLVEQGHWVRCVDWAENTYFATDEFFNEFVLGDLRDPDVCRRAVDGCDWVFNMAADMGGMVRVLACACGHSDARAGCARAGAQGFIMSNAATLMHNNALIDTQLIEAARQAGVKRYFYASSACVYPARMQESTQAISLCESYAGAGEPEDDYGFEKRWGERVALAYGKDFEGFEVRVGRFHNIYGPQGTWRGGREKVPAAFCRKALTSDETFEVWGDGEQTRSFCFVDDCVDGVLRLMRSDCSEPLNIGSDELVSMNDLARLAIELAGRTLELRHVKGPQGVRGRNSDNTLIRKRLDWAPSITLKDGLQRTMCWIDAQLQQERAAGVNVEAEYAKSRVVQMRTPEAGGGAQGVRE